MPVGGGGAAAAAPVAAAAAAPAAAEKKGTFSNPVLCVDQTRAKQFLDMMK